MDIKSLKDKILQLAIQGKLVSQNESDEPARVLLDRIKQEKEQLIKDKVIKKEKLLPEISDEDKLFGLPKGWEWCRLGEINTFINGDRGKNYPSKRDLQDIGIPFINAGHLNNGNIEMSNMNYISEEKFNLLSSGKVKSNDLIYCLRGTLGKNAIVNNLDKGAIASSLVIMRLINDNYIDIKYIYCFINSPLELIQREQYNNGSAQPNLSAESVKNFLIPIPPLAEQKRIVAKVEELFKLIDELDNNKQDLLENISNTRNKVLQLAIQGKLVEQCEEDEPASVLLEKIKREKEQLIKDKIIKREKLLQEISEEEKQFDLPKGWEWIKMGEVGIWGAGSTPSRANSGYYNGNIPWIKTGELNDGYIYDSEEKITEIALNESSLKLNPIGSVLIAMYGATIGKVGILQVEATTNQACCACTTHSVVYNRYLFIVLLSMRSYFKSQSFGGAQPNISKQKIINTPMALPPLEEQKRIVAKVDLIMDYLDKLQQEIESQEIILEDIIK